MGKVIFEYDTNDEPAEIVRVIRSIDMAMALHDFENELRKVWKYTDDVMKAECASYWRDVFYRCLGDNNVHMDEILQ